MVHRFAGATAVVASAGLWLSVPACAQAEPVTEPVAPQPDASCAEYLEGAYTRLPDGKTVLECRSVPGGHRWKLFGGTYPSSDRWLSYGDGVTLYGQGRRNPEIKSGQWVGRPLDSETRCAVEQAVVVRAGEVGPRQRSTGEPGQPLEFEVLPVAFSVTLTGDCLWQQAA